jgi:hypothetical protein
MVTLAGHCELHSKRPASGSVSGAATFAPGRREIADRIMRSLARRLCMSEVKTFEPSVASTEGNSKPPADAGHSFDA